MKRKKFKKFKFEKIKSFVDIKYLYVFVFIVYQAPSSIYQISVVIYNFCGIVIKNRKK